MNAHAEGLQKRTVIQLQKLAFVEDVSDMPDDERQKFADYIVETSLDAECDFPAFHQIYSFFNSGSKAHKSTQTEDKKHNTQHKKTEKHKTQG